MPALHLPVDQVPVVLAQYPAIGIVRNVTALLPAELGFSGAQLWRVTADAGLYCLRRWPPSHPSRARRQFLHNLLTHLGRQGIDYVPIPLSARNGGTWVEMSGQLWELTRWLPGAADFHDAPTTERLTAAVVALARVHRSAESWQTNAPGIPPAVTERCDQVVAWQREGLDALRKALRTSAGPALDPLATAFLQRAPQCLPQVAAQLRDAATNVVPLQPVLRDVWHDHVLFTGDRVSGLIDFAAARVDTVACDLARLLGSLVPGDAMRQAEALAAYERLRPLSSVERAFIPCLDHSAVVLGGLNWLRWIYLERRTFPDPSRVERRLRHLLDRLQQPLKRVR
ncbi:MAG: phosphotransferase enzyme family protein [Pirellulaceae bacterium]